MNNQLEPRELELYLAIDSILLNEWDPIGIAGIAEAKTEYHAYLPQVFSMVMRNATPENIAAYLHQVITEQMALKSNMTHQITIANKALAAKNQINLQSNRKT